MKWSESLHIPWYVVVSALMVVIACILRLIAYRVEGHDDTIMTQLLTAAMALFTGSFAIARAASNRNGNGKGDHQ